MVSGQPLWAVCRGSPLRPAGRATAGMGVAGPTELSGAAVTQPRRVCSIGALFKTCVVGTYRRSARSWRVCDEKLV